MEPRTLFALPDEIDVAVQSLAATGAAARAIGRSEPDGPDGGLSLDELHLQDLTIGWQQQAFEFRPAPRTPMPSDGTRAWTLAPLENLSGELSVHVTDAAWVLDADVRLPIRAGGIDFNQATVSHVGPDSSMGLSRMGVYVDAPNGRQYLAMVTGTRLDGARFEQRGALLGSLVTDRGALALAPLVQAVLDGARPFTPAAGAQALLRRTRVEGSFQLGDGALGPPDLGPGLVLAGAAAGRNRVVLASTPGGGWLLRCPELSAEQLQWPLGASGTGRAASLSGSLSVEWAQQPGAGARVTLRAPQLLLRGVRLQPGAAAPAQVPGESAAPSAPRVPGVPGVPGVRAAA